MRRLTDYSIGGGCGCKYGAQSLSDLLQSVDFPIFDGVLLDGRSFDDAAIVSVRGSQSMAFTVDFFTPVVDCPYDFGRIAANNSLNDLYAKGSEAMYALNIVCFPPEGSIAVLKEILQGGADLCRSNGVSVVGGHTIQDSGVKFGLAAVGLLPCNVWSQNSCASIGDYILLTKPIGTGVLGTAIKHGVADEPAINEGTRWMVMSGKCVASCIMENMMSCCTDVTGFGLVGHLLEVAIASKVDIELHVNKIPVLESFLALCSQGIRTGGGERNRSAFANRVVNQMEMVLPEVIFDPQSAGGFLCFVREDNLQVVSDILKAAGHLAVHIGHVLGSGDVGSVVCKNM